MNVFQHSSDSVLCIDVEERCVVDVHVVNYNIIKSTHAIILIRQSLDERSSAYLYVMTE